MSSFFRHALCFLRHSKWAATGAISSGTFLALSLYDISHNKSDILKQAFCQPVNDIRKADLFYEDFRKHEASPESLQKAYEILKRYRSSTNPECLWRLARVIWQMAMNCTDQTEKKRLLVDALGVARGALENEFDGKEEGSFESHKWYAVVLTYLSQLEGHKAEINNAMEIKSHFERALQLNPLDAMNWHLLGLWHFFFANMWTYQRLVAIALYGTPPTTNFQEALLYLDRAETVSPGFYSFNTLLIGLCLEQINGRKAEALDQIKKAFTAPINSNLDEQTHKEAASHLRKKYGFTDEQLGQLLK